MSGIFNSLHTNISTKACSSCSSSSSSSSSSSAKKPESGIFEKAREIANRYHGKLVQDYFSICKGKNALKFNCLNQHTFYVAVEDLSEDSWCSKCQEFFEKCSQAASENYLRVISGLYEDKISLCCNARNHEFKISYSKKLNSLSCADCRKEDREEWKEQLRQEEQQRTEENLRKQRELFEKAAQEAYEEESEEAAPNANSYSSYYQQYYNQYGAYYGYYQQQQPHYSSYESSWRSAPSSSQHFIGGAQ